MFGRLEPDVYFYGERSRRLATTNTVSIAAASRPACSPRRAGTSSAARATINLEDYAVLRNAVLRVKEVPVFYLPILYYPIQSDDRATGFLMPAYGNSTYQGTRSATRSSGPINRSQDATLFHDYRFSRGQGYGAGVSLRGGSPAQKDTFAPIACRRRRPRWKATAAPWKRRNATSFELRGQHDAAAAGRLSATAALRLFLRHHDAAAQSTPTSWSLDYSTRIDARRRHWLAGATSLPTLRPAEANRLPRPSSRVCTARCHRSPLGCRARSSARLPLFVSRERRTIATTSSATFTAMGSTTAITAASRCAIASRTASAAALSHCHREHAAGATTYFSEASIGSDAGPMSRRELLRSSVDLTGPVFNRVFAQGDVDGANSSTSSNRRFERAAHHCHSRIASCCR